VPKPRIGIIASGDNQKRNAHELLESEEFDLTVGLSSMEKAIPIGQEMIEKGVDVILAYRGTAVVLREKLSVPVMTIPFSFLDIILSLKEAAKFGNKILLTVFRGKKKGVDTLSELINREIFPGDFNDIDSLERAIIWGKQQGCRVVVGGGFALEFAKKHGLIGVDFHSSLESMVDTIEEAVTFIKSRQRELEKAARYQKIIESTSEGMIVVDRNGIIQIINKAARGLLDSKEEECIGKNICTYIPNSSIAYNIATRNFDENQVEKLFNQYYVFTNGPVYVDDEIIGGIVSFKSISNLRKTQTDIDRSFSNKFRTKYKLDDFIYQSNLVDRLMQKAQRFAATESTVLIQGETGTGKEILAHGIHNNSKRKRLPFVSINCAAISDQLLESELFGYEEGAFTGSRKGGKQGLFELAHKGTLFLDEIGAMSLRVQTRLLRVLQERELMRVGGDRLIPIDVRIIAATNEELLDKINAGQFREDIFFRLNVLKLNVPPLKNRIEDIPILADRLVEKVSADLAINPLRLPEQYLEKLMNFNWPGNVRQLLNFIEQIVVLSNGKFNPEIFSDAYDELISRYSRVHPVQNDNQEIVQGSLKVFIKDKLVESEAQIIQHLIDENNGNKTKTAKQMGISRSTLWRKLRCLGLDN
jgi:propionate catabolism operon transcriptional regulator